MNLLFAIISAVTIVQGKLAVDFQNNNKIFLDKLALKTVGASENLKFSLSYDLFGRKINEGEISWIFLDNWMITGGKYKPYIGSYFTPHESFWDWFGLSYTEYQVIPDSVRDRMGITVLYNSDYFKLSVGAFSSSDTFNLDTLLFVPNVNFITSTREFYIGGGFKKGYKSALAGISHYTRYHMEWFELAYNFQTKKLWGKQAIKFQVPYFPLTMEVRVEEGIQRDKDTMPLRITTVSGVTLFNNTLSIIHRATIHGQVNNIRNGKVIHSLFLVFTF